MKKRWLAVLGTCLGLGPRPAAAQVRPGEPLRLPAFDSGVASTSTSEGVAVNPAGLAFLPGTELRLTSRYLDDRSLETAQGHAVTSAFQIPLVSLSTALRLDLVDPPARAARRSFGTNANYQWLTWGLAYRPWAGVAVGLSLQGSWSSRPELDGLKSWSLGTVLRASDVLSLGFVGQDLNRPEGPGDVRVSPSYHAALSLRPLATRAVELELGTAYVDASPGYWLPRAALGVDLPGLGRLSGDFALRDPTEERGERRWQAGLSVTVRLEGSSLSAELGAGSVVGDTLGPDAEWQAHQNVSTTVAARGFRERPAIATSEYALRIRLEDAPSARRHVALLRQLWAIAEHERDVQAVVLQIRAAAAGSLAHIEELRDAIALLRSRGKQVLCQLEDAGGATLYLCSAADRIVMTPSGRLRFAGFSSRYFYVPELLDKLGVKAEYARIGAHKSAPEMFSHQGASDVAAADHTDLLQQFERQMIWGIALGRQMDPLELRRRLARGPFSAEDARRAGLIDRVAHGDELDATLSTDAGEQLPIRDATSPLMPARHGRGRAVAVIYVDGDMVDGRSRKIPLLGISLVGSYTVAEAIDRASRDPNVGAILLRAETPGGSALAADLIWRKLVLAKQKKPVIVSIGGVGASAGYYIASAGARVFASPLSVTGSIGVFAGKVDASELLRKVGVSVETYKTAPRADADSLFRPLSADERRELERKVGQFYDLFLDRVSRGRSQAGVRLDKPAVDAAGQGRVWTGAQALDRKLVDELGGLRHALREARRLAKLPEDAPIVELPEQTGPWLYRMLGLAAATAPAAASPDWTAPLDALRRALGPWTVYPQQWPLFRMEFVPVE